MCFLGGMCAIRRVRKIVKSFYQLRYVCLSVSRSAWNKSATTGRIFIKFWCLNIFGKHVQKIQVSLKSEQNNGYFT